MPAYVVVVPIAALAAYLVKGATGLGSAIVFVGAASLTLTPRQVVPLSVVLDIAGGGLLLSRTGKRSVESRPVALLLPGIVAGSIVGAFALSDLSSHVMYRVMGAMIIAGTLLYVSQRATRSPAGVGDEAGEREGAGDGAGPGGGDPDAGAGAGAGGGYDAAAGVGGGGEAGERDSAGAAIGVGRGDAAPGAGDGAPRRVGTVRLVCGGLVAGVFGGAVNIDGPPLAITLGWRGGREGFRGTITLLLLIADLIRVPIFGGLDLFDVHELELVGLALPFVAAGTLAGVRLHARIPDAAFGAVVAMLLLASGIELLVK